ncbi:MAG: nucleotide sugar dehydrogenase [bacterium]
MKRVSILGLGYIGLPTAIIAAEAGYSVFGFDVDKVKVDKINAGNPPILENELKDRLAKSLRKNYFKISTNLEYADCFVITVPTPFKDHNKADLKYVFKAAEYIAERLMPGNLIILESTVPVGTTEKFALFIEEISGLKVNEDFFVAHCPERGIPGHLFKELIDNDRVIGGLNQKACNLAYLFYSRFVKGFLHITDDKTAEMVKLVENSSRDVQIAFANQVAAMCQATGIDPYHVIELANKHPRVNILSPACGVGGHCVAVDPWFLVESFPEHTQLLQVARAVNDEKPYKIVEEALLKVEELRDHGLERPKVLALGLAFKPNVDDMRESPALKIVQELMMKADRIDLIAYDPYVKKEDIQKAGIREISDFHKELRSADIVLILVKHDKFLVIPEEILSSKVIIDTCGILHDIQKRTSKSILGGVIRTKATSIFENITF